MQKTLHSYLPISCICSCRLQKSQIIAQAQELAKAISSGTQQQSKSDVATEIEKLFELKQKGILTEAEFIARKKKILEE